MIVLFAMTSTVSMFSIYHTQIFHLDQIVFMFVVSIFVNIPFLYFLMKLYVNNIINIFNNKLYITGLLNRDNRFLYCNCKVTGESIILIQQENKFKVHEVFITLENNFVFLIIIFIVFRFFKRKQRKVMLFRCFLVFDSSFKI